MKILVLGTGLQGKAVLHDLALSPEVSEILAADVNIQDLERFVGGLGSDKIKTFALDAHDHNRVRELMRAVDAVVVLLPTTFRLPMAQLAVEVGVHMVDASYPLPEYQALGQEAEKRGVTILPECGLDPGIDLVLSHQAAKELDVVHEYLSYGAGVPEPAAADNPLKYKISWTFAGVLNGYSRPARFHQDGQIFEVPAEEIFHEANVHIVSFDELGELEAYPNGDASRYLDLLGIKDTVHNAGRYSMRWPGHSALWKKWIDLGFLDEEPVQVGDKTVVPRQFLHDFLLPKLQYGPTERDVAVVRVVMGGLKDGKPKRVNYQVVDYRNLDTGFLAMQRTVGYTASVCTQMILRGEVQGRGLLSPIVDVPPGLFFEALGKRGIQVVREEYTL